jgi:4-amino-4-deoxy-L-arabinose transferase-like glycosyltransferase
MGAAVLLHIALSVSHSLTQRPWSDEGAMASPAYDLINRGSMGTRLWEEAGSPFQGVNTHTYYLMPLHLVAQSVWYRLTGVSLLSMRLFSLMWALVAMTAWFLLMRRLFDLNLAALTVTLISLDYFVLVDSSFGRMDMMSAALGFSGLAGFVLLRERSFALALLISNALVAAAIFTHAIAITHFCGLIFLVLYLNWRDVRLGHVVLAAAPYLVGGLLWGLYILQSPHDFEAQFSWNAGYMGRLHALTAPWAGVWREITVRYGVGYGLGSHNVGNRGPIFLKSVALLAYLAGLIGCLLTPSIRRDPRRRIFIILPLMSFLVMSLIDGTKNHYYLAHITPWLAAALAIWVTDCAEKKVISNWILAAGLLGLVAVQAAGIAYKVRLDSYHVRYYPAVAFLKTHIRPDSLVMASSAFGFDLDLTGKLLVDDAGLGYYSGKKADFVVVDEIYLDTFEGHKLHRPGVAIFVSNLLKSEYRVIYSQGDITVYQRITSLARWQPLKRVVLPAGTSAKTNRPAAAPPDRVRN